MREQFVLPPLRVEDVPAVRWQSVGEPPRLDDVAEIRHEIGKCLARECAAVTGLGPEGSRLIYRYVKTGNPEQDAFRELVAMASIPLDHAIEGLNPPEPGLDHEAEVGRVAHEDRRQRTFVTRLAEVAGTMLYRERSAMRRTRRGQR